MKDRKLFGTNALVEEFIERLRKVNTLDGGWSTEYVDPETGKHWLQYVVDDHGFFQNMMLISPRPTTYELIEIAFSSPHQDEIAAAATRLTIEEQTDKKEFRQKLLDKLEQLDLSLLNEEERERVKTIIQASQLTDRINRRDTMGKDYSEVCKDALFFQATGEKAHEILSRL